MRDSGPFPLTGLPRRVTRRHTDRRHCLQAKHAPIFCKQRLYRHAERQQAVAETRHRFVCPNGIYPFLTDSPKIWSSSACVPPMS